jgi:hypothetical protein
MARAAQRGKPQPNSPWHEDRAEAQSPQRKRFFLSLLRDLRASAREFWLDFPQLLSL